MTTAEPTNQTPAIESTLEVLDLASGQRQIVYRAPEHFEAPNWSRDGNFWVFNRAGKLCRLDRGSANPVVIDTGFADRNNNDHGISPNGTQLVISHHAQEVGGDSLIYVLPIQGGTPRKITARGPSYWHGWSPDGNTLVYTAGRPGKPSFNILACALNGGEEVFLTDTDTLDDGPDYSPDGRHIYFNSHRSGVMQIWRMEEDGANPTQMVRSDCSDWFPHPSPDGKRVVFLRYLSDLGQDHPFGKDVQLMSLDPETGVVEALTGVFFGGQGTINVPSWSPDSKRLAFVSYRLLG